MLGKSLENNLTRFLALGLLLCSIVVSTSGLTDPVNVPKLLVLGTFAIGSIGYLIQPRKAEVKFSQRKIAALLISFVFIALAVSIKSDAPFTQNLYGVYGRNNGFLTYLFLSILFFCGTHVVNRENHYIFLKSVIYVGFVNLAYCLWVILFGDFLPWNNTYGNVLGTFGNPNFIGAYLGILFGVLLALGVSHQSSRRFKISLIFLLPLTLFEIIKSHAIQGRVLAALSVVIVGFFFLRFRFKPIFSLTYLAVSVLAGFTALAGALQFGPLTEIIYKTSISLRGQYWLAAWNTGKTNPMFGVGMDGFGDWYRRSRDIRALELPGVNVVVNTAHNVPLDMFAFGGWPLFIAYLTVMFFAFKSLVVIAFKIRSYDGVAVGLISAWVCYQAQSVISINQIGLAVWGWILSGLLIGYERYLSVVPDLDKHSKSSAGVKKSQRIEATPGSIIGVGALSLIGLLIALPPVTAELRIREALNSRDALKLEKTMQSSYFNPPNVQKYILNIQALERSGLYKQSHKYALEAVKWNPNSFDLWRFLYLINNSSDEEKVTAAANLKRLDPLNPDVTK